MTTNKDTDLREALRRRYTDTPTLPADFSDRLMERMDTKPTVSHLRHWWCRLSAAAACLLVAVGLWVYYEFNKVPQPVVQLSGSYDKAEYAQLSKQMHPKKISSTPNRTIECTQSNNCVHSTEQLAASNRGTKRIQPTNRAHSTEIPDTLGSSIWHSERNVALAIQMLSECETTILREEREMRNHIIQATFNATPQPANTVLVTNEAGDYEVIETKTIIEI